MGQVLAATSGSNGSAAVGGVFLLLIFVVGAAFYFLPLIVALIRKMPNVGSIAVINFFLGWTFVGWIVAMAMACGSATRNVVVNQYSGTMAFQSPLLQPQVATATAQQGWLADPSSRHQMRYWDGARWTDQVSNNGAQSIDPI